MKVIMPRDLVRQGEAFAALADGHGVICTGDPQHRSWRVGSIGTIIDQGGFEMSSKLIMDWRGEYFAIVDRKTRIQKMAEEAVSLGNGLLSDVLASFGDRVVREVCKYLRAESAGPFASDVEREFLGIQRP